MITTSLEKVIHVRTDRLRGETEEIIISVRKMINHQ